MRNETPNRRAFRDALGQFATGVTVVGAKDPQGGLIGLTVSSFNSVSLDPPLVLWSLAKSSGNLEGFVRAGHFAVNVLAADQVALSHRFAGASGNKFDGVDVEEGAGGSPLLAGCVARFQCRTVFRYEGGDHLIFVGEVLDFDTSDRPALLFHRGAYGVCSPHPGGSGEDSFE